MSAYYNDTDPFCCDVLRARIADGSLPAGDVDGRDIREVRADDLEGYAQVHLFAGIGGWPYALRLAGWLDDEPVWTGSCPCQPFSVAGRATGVGDERHLWPAFHRLIAECEPAIVFGEQVASKDGRLWLAGVRTDLEHLGYAVGAADLPAAGVGAPHIRQRLWWVANSVSSNQRRYAGDPRSATGPGSEKARTAHGNATDGATPDGGVAVSDGGNAQTERLQRSRQHGQRAQDGRIVGGLADTEGAAARSRDDLRAGKPDAGENRGLGYAALSRKRTLDGQSREITRPQKPSGGSSLSFWSAFDLIPCGDGKSRRVEPGTFPLAHGVPARMGKLRAYGNAISPQVAAEFIAAFMEIRDAV